MAMSRIIIISCLLGFCLNGIGQESRYWISFKDKTNCGYQIDKPQEFLTSRAIERRQRQGISVIEQDLPINRKYIDTVLQETGGRQMLGSKWFNSVLVLAPTGLLDKILKIHSVSTAKEYPLTKKKQKLVDKFEANEVVEILFDGYTSSDYGAGNNQIRMLGAQHLHTLGYDGSDMLIAVLDAGFTGVDKVPGFKAMRDQIIGTKDFVDGDNYVYHRHTHGTRVLSCIAGKVWGKYLGTAPGAKFILLTTEDSGSETIIEEYNWAAGLEFADSIGADIANTSLGYTRFDDSTQNHTYQDMDGNTTFAAKAADIAASKGMLLVTSAGNMGNNDWHYISTPADADSTLTVGAVDSLGNPAGFSSFGPSSDNEIKPNVCAQGELSSVIGTGGIHQGNGTSFSAPIMAGAVACLWQALPNRTNMEIIDLVERSASRYSNPTEQMGYGIPNLYHVYLSALVFNKNPENLEIDELIGSHANIGSSRINMAYYSSADQEVQLQLVSATGQIVQLGNRNFHKGLNAVSIENRNQLEGGLYFLSVVNSKGEKRTQKIILI